MKPERNRIMNQVIVFGISLIWMLTGSQFSTFARNSQQDDNSYIRWIAELADCRDWEKVRDEKGVKIRTRWLLFGDTVKTREISLSFITDADTKDILVNLMQPEKVMKWNEGVRSFQLLKNEGSTWITHTVYDIPYPLSQQDLVVRNVMLQEGKRTVILVTALPGYISLLENINRQQLYFGKWELSPSGNGFTEVKFSAVSFSKSGIPRFIRDPIVFNRLFNSFLKLKEQASSNENKIKNQEAYQLPVSFKQP
jgi:hypothetical protein